MASSSGTVLFLGGNGHCAARLAPARCLRPPFQLIEVPYPGFEGRPRAATLEVFLERISPHLASQGPPATGGSGVVYATGIGGLLALCLRARGAGGDWPIILQGPVLWGLKHRLMPRLMRLAPAQALVGRVFSLPLFRRRFVRRYFTRPPSSEGQDAFFDGYAQCAALPDFFRWLTPALLRDLEARFTAHPERLTNIRVWWGGQDRVVGLPELRWTEKALHTTFPLRIFPDWGHYPMLDDPQGWVNALTEVMDEQR